MKKLKKKRCRHCRCLFVPDPRNIKKQDYCRKEPCRKASKSASQKRWLSKPDNKDYFKGPDHVERVREWRRNHPGYWKRSIALQDHSNVQPVEKIDNNDRFDVNALQDLLLEQPPVIIGLISNFIGSPLQDDIADTLYRMQQSGQDILCLQPQLRGGNNDCKITHPKTTDPQGSQVLQLD